MLGSLVLGSLLVTVLGSLVLVLGPLMLVLGPLVLVLEPPVLGPVVISELALVP